MLVAQARQIQSRPNILRHVVKHLLVLALEPCCGALIPDIPAGLPAMPVPRAALSSPTGKPYDAENVKHHVDLFQSELLAFGEPSGFFGQHVKVKCQTVPGGDGESRAGHRDQIIYKLHRLVLLHLRSWCWGALPTMPKFRRFIFRRKCRGARDPKRPEESPVKIIAGNVRRGLNVESEEFAGHGECALIRLTLRSLRALRFNPLEVS
ncbi:MAG: hypothetical protein U1E51_20195 [Candidatus Binatia bacterium]|nr:hypothetical protein [Candidatus Binatia bacterium]